MMKTVALCTEPIEAHILKGRLEAEGIPTVLFNAYYIGMDWTISVALGGVLIQVPPSCELQALDVVAKIYNGEYEKDLADEIEFSEPITCIRCGSENIKNIRWLSTFSLLNLLGFNIFVPVILSVIPTSRYIYTCKSCKKYWIAHEMRPYYLSSYAALIILATLLAMFVYAAPLLIYWLMRVTAHFFATL